MPDNYPVKDGGGATETFASKNIGGIQYPFGLGGVLFGGAFTPFNGDVNGNLGVTVFSTVLPSGASTAANQATIIASSAAAAAALGAIGDTAWTLSGNATLVQTTKKIAALLNAGIAVTFPSAQAVSQSGTWTVGLSTGANVIGKVGMQVGGSDVANGNPVPVSVQGTAAATQSGAWNVGQAGAWNVTLLTGANVIGGVTQSGTWTVGLSAGAAVIGAVTQSGTWNSTQAGTWNVGLSTGSNVIGKVSIQVGGSDVAVGNPLFVTGAVTVTGTAQLTAGEAIIGHIGQIQATPTSGALTRPANTTAYPQLAIIASNTAAGSIAVPSVTVARLSAGSLLIKRARLYTNHTTGLGGVVLKIRLWSAAPTYTNGDGAAYAPATTAAGVSFIGSMIGTFEQWGDSATMQLVPEFGEEINIVLASGQLIYWDIQTLDVFTPQSGKTFTFVPEVTQN